MELKCVLNSSFQNDQYSILHTHSRECVEEGQTSINLTSYLMPSVCCWNVLLGKIKTLPLMLLGKQNPATLSLNELNQLHKFQCPFLYKLALSPPPAVKLFRKGRGWEVLLLFGIQAYRNHLKKLLRFVYFHNHSSQLATWLSAIGVTIQKLIVQS